MAKLRIISTPPGQAPEYIRRAWLGLELPLAVSKPKAVHSAGVVSGRGSLGVWLGLLTGAVKENSGWVVPAEGALAVLEVSRPDAAQWWRVNLPHLFTPGRKLVFATACGEAVAEPGDPPVPANSSDPNPTPLVLLLLIEIGCALGIAAIIAGWTTGWLNMTWIRLWLLLVFLMATLGKVLLLIIARVRRLSGMNREDPRNML